MQTFKLYRRDIIIDKVPEWKSPQDAPIVFGLGNRGDERSLFFSSVLYYPELWHAIHLYSYHDASIEIMNRLDPENEIYTNKSSPSHNPHTILKTGEFTFIFTYEDSVHIDMIDLVAWTITLYWPEDLNFPGLSKVTDISATVFADTTHPWHFYTGVSGISTETGRQVTYLYRGDFTLNSFEIIARTGDGKVTHRGIAPHVIRQVGDTLLSSQFSIVTAHFIEQNLSFTSSRQILLHIYGRIYSMWCSEKWIEPKDDHIKNNLIHEGRNFKCLDQELNQYIEELYIRFDAKNFVELVFIVAGEIKLLPGLIWVVHLSTGKQSAINTTRAAPAHFEIMSDKLYISSHNFTRFDKRYFFWPAAIDKFSCESDGSFKKLATFTHPTGFRFTSHRAFVYKGVSYVSTIGQPSRLFIIREDTMELDSFCDLEPNVLSELWDSEKIRTHLNRNLWEPAFVAFEVSEDGAFITAIGSNNVVIFSMESRSVVQSIPFTRLINTGVPWKNQFFTRHAHCQYFL